MKRLDDKAIQYFIKLKEKVAQAKEMAELYNTPEYSPTPAETKMLLKMLELLLPNDQLEDEVNKDSPAKDLMMELLEEVGEDE